MYATLVRRGECASWPRAAACPLPPADRMPRLLPMLARPRTASRWPAVQACRAATHSPAALGRRSAGTAATAAEDSCPAAGHGCDCSFDTALIRSAKPFPRWLQEEMRSNHAGETGAVEIYNGALWALAVRRRIAAAVGSGGADGGGGGGAEGGGSEGSAAASSYDTRLAAFAAEHRASEQHHLDLLNEIIEPAERSWLLPVSRLA